MIYSRKPLQKKISRDQFVSGYIQYLQSHPLFCIAVSMFPENYLREEIIDAKYAAYLADTKVF